MIDVSIVPNMQYLRTEELLLRWLELSAVADGIFRTHIGNLPNSSVQVRSGPTRSVGQTAPCAKTPFAPAHAEHCGGPHRLRGGARHVCVWLCDVRACVCLFRVP